MSLTEIWPTITAPFNQSMLINWLEQGGPVVWVLSFSLLIFWWLVVDKLFYLGFVFPAIQKKRIAQWQNRDNKATWHSARIKEGWLSEAWLQLNANLSLIKSLVSLFPMIGLLGTVTGMIQVFESMAQSGDVQGLAKGISMATVPTMAGMVAAVIGMFIYSRLKKAITVRQVHFQRVLRVVQ